MTLTYQMVGLEDVSAGPSEGIKVIYGDLVRVVVLSYPRLNTKKDHNVCSQCPGVAKYRRNERHGLPSKTWATPPAAPANRSFAVLAQLDASASIASILPQASKSPIMSSSALSHPYVKIEKVNTSRVGVRKDWMMCSKRTQCGDTFFRSPR